MFSKFVNSGYGIATAIVVLSIAAAWLWLYVVTQINRDESKPSGEVYGDGEV